MKTGAVCRLGDVTKLLQTQPRDSQWSTQDILNGGAFPPNFREADKVGGPGVSVAGNF